MARSECALLLLTLVAAASGKLPEWYACSCAASAQEGNTRGCVCPSTAPPGGLQPTDTPQFILFTHDDAITPAAEAAFRSILEGRRSLDGCKATATLFTLARGTDCELLRGLHRDGYEVASHSLSHQKMNGWGRAEVEAEVVGGRAALASRCTLPEADIVGWRSPFLMASPIVRQVLLEAGFTYDSTLLEEPKGGSVSRGMDARLWPYLLQDGIPQDCARWEPYQQCTHEERYPGLFEVPVWDLSDTGLFSSDPADRSGRSIFEVLKAAFDAAYNGNRAPLPIYVHSSFFTAEGVQAMQRFADYALSQPHTYFVTMAQAVRWVRNPVPASRLTPADLSCGNPGGAPIAAPAAAPAAGSALPTATAGAAAAGGAAVPPTSGPPLASTAAPVANAPLQEAASNNLSASVPLLPSTGSGQVAAGGSGQQESVAAPASAELPIQAQPDAAAAFATTAAAQEGEQQGQAGGAASGGKAVNLAAVLGGALGGAAAVALLAAVAAVVSRRRQRRASAEAAVAASSAQRSAYATHLYATHMQQPGATAHIGHARSLKDQFELTEVVEQSGTPGGSARRRVPTAFN